MSKIKRLAGETVLYGLGSMLPKFLNFLLVSLHTSVFAPEAYGVITKVFSYVGVINVIFTFGMETAYFRFAVKAGSDEQKVFNITQSVVIGISLFFTIIFVTSANSIASFMEVPGHSEVVLWLSAIMFIDAVVSIPFARLRLQKKAIQFAIFRIMNVAILIGLNMYFLKVVYDPAIGINYVFLANLIANVSYLVFFFKLLITWRPAYDPIMTPKIATYAYPVMISGLAGMTNEMFSRQTLDWWLPKGFYPGKTSEYALGIFGACYKFGTFMNLAVTAFRYAAEPFFFSNAADKESPQLFAKVNHYFVIVCCIILLGVSLNLDIIKYFLRSPLYWEGLPIVPVLLLAYLFLGIYYNLSVCFKLTDKTYFGTIITVGGALFTVAGNYIIIPVAGYMGSTWITLACYFLMTVASYLLGRKLFPIPYDVGRTMSYIIGTTLLVYAANLLTFDNQWIAILYHNGVIVSYLLTVYLVEKKDFKLASG
ncbi:MAG: polysaccharide biosynthesis C-terminal domain-containing protein [Chryseolinea sp.]